MQRRAIAAAQGIKVAQVYITGNGGKAIVCFHRQREHPAFPAEAQKLSFDALPELVHQLHKLRGKKGEGILLRLCCDAEASVKQRIARRCAARTVLRPCVDEDGGGGGRLRFAAQHEAFEDHLVAGLIAFVTAPSLIHMVQPHIGGGKMHAAIIALMEILNRTFLPLTVQQVERPEKRLVNAHFRCVHIRAEGLFPFRTEKVSKLLLYQGLELLLRAAAQKDRAADAGAAIDAAGTAADAPVLQGGGFCVRGGARMKALIESILQGYGSLVTVRDGQSARTFRALVQPVTEKGWASTRKLIESLGRVPKGQYVYIGPAEMEIKQGQTVEVRQEAYVVRRSETMALGDETLYVWALLTKAGGAESWNS